jgi:hypothetical protein
VLAAAYVSYQLAACGAAGVCVVIQTAVPLTDPSRHGFGHQSLSEQLPDAALRKSGKFKLGGKFGRGGKQPFKVRSCIRVAWLGME